MQLLALISALATILAGSWIGLRLLALSRRSGHAPERWIGLGLTAFAGVAYPLLLLLAGGVANGSRVGILVLTAGACAGYLACLVCIAGFTRSVFRANAAWAVWIVAGLAAVELAGVGFTMFGAFHGQSVASAETTFTGQMGSGLMALAFAGVFAWAACEALRYHHVMRRRLALGLADAVVVNRFWLWGTGTAAAAVLDLGILLCVAVGMNAAHDALPMLLQSATGVVNALTWWLAFAPPQRYLELVRARQG